MESKGFIFDTWSHLYHHVFKENHFAFYAIGSLLIITVLFWGVAAIFMFVDLTGRPKWMLKYKIQPGVNQPVDPTKLWTTARVSFINQMFVGMPVLYALFPLAQYMGSRADPESLPSTGTILRDFGVSVLVSEVFFYYAHRLFHWGPLYRRFHKRHHEWTAPVGVAAFYCHPLEHVCCNMPTLVAGMTLMGSHLYTTFLWYSFGIILTVVNHSNYHLPFSPIPPEFHDYHHYKFINNFGSELGILDRLHGTDKYFRKSIERRRNRILFGLKSANELVPGDLKVKGS